MEFIHKPLSYAGVNRIRFKGSDSKESSQFARTPPGPYIAHTVLEITFPVNVYDALAPPATAV